MDAIPGYQIRQRIHHTARYVIHKGLREADDKEVLLKIPVTDFPDKALDQRFEREFSTGQELTHSGIIPYLAIEKSPSGRTLVLENFEGVPLSSMLKQGKLEAEVFLPLAIQLSDVLDHIHRSGYIHKNINPENILVNPAEKQLRIVDLSQATRVVQEKQQPVNPELLEGALEYISPEQTGRMNRSIDYRTDLYSAGVCFYHMLCGRPPFSFGSPLETIHAHIAKELPPLHEADTGVPKILSAIVAKLLAKNAEDRYQSASGLSDDLKTCLDAAKGLANLKFSLGRNDFSGKLQIPQKLYGRSEQIKALLNAFERIRKGGLELILVEGSSGTGKTSLVHEIQRPVSLANGYFIQGKSDQLLRSVPYLPWIQALSNLIDQLLTLEEQQLNVWSERVLQAVGANGKALTDVFPNLESLIGKQPELPEIESGQAQNRFNYVFKRFTQALTADQRPLVLFLDDMQWADAASLNLLKTLLSEGDAENLMVILSYRSNEVNAAHPLILTLEDLRQSPVSFQTIQVENLSRNDITTLISETLEAPEPKVADLTQLIYEKTQGNAFFVNGFLKALADNGHLAFNFEKKAWEWDPDKIRQLNITNNVVELLTGNIRQLPAPVLNVLKMAACIGNRFDQATLQIISESSLSSLLPALETAQIERYIEKTGPEQYKFAHDRIHQAFYEQIPRDDKQNAHVRIGKMLFLNTPANSLEQQVFTIVNHWNTGLDTIRDTGEQRNLFGLNLQAAGKAKTANAYQAAKGYLQAASYLGEKFKLSEQDPDWFPLQKEKAEVAFLLSEFDQSEAIIRDTLEKTRQLRQQTSLYRMLALQYTMDSKYGEAIEVGRNALRLLGIDIPVEGLESEIGKEIGQVFGRLGDQPVSSLVRAPLMKEEQHIMAAELLAVMLAPSFFANQALFALVVTKIVNLSLEHGNIPSSCFGYGCFGIILSAALGDYQKGLQFGELAYDLAHRLQDPTEQGRACFHLAEFTSLWTKPLSYARERNREGFLAALDAGDLQYAGYLSIYDAVYPSYQERHLEKVLPAAEESLAFNRRTQNLLGADTVLGFKMALSCLSGKTPGDQSFDIEEISEAKYLAHCMSYQNVLAVCIFQITKGCVLYFHGYPEKALAALKEAEQFLPFIGGMLFTAEHNFYSSMSMAAMCHGKSREEQEEFLARIAANQEKMKILAENCPENWRHKYLLVEAETARINKRRLKAIDLYQEAIALAGRHDFLSIQALGNERLANLWISKDVRAYAGLHLKEALYCYGQWGAKHKMDELDGQLSRLGLAGSSSLTVQEHTADATSESAKTAVSTLDMESVLKASQALSSEIVLEKLLDKMMRIVVENAGAQTGFLIVERKGEWFIQAEGRADGAITVLQNQPIKGAMLVAESVVQYAARTHESVVVQDAAQDKRFFSDPYVVGHKPKSILCTSVWSSGNRTAILYLENNLVAGAFTNERVELLKVLSSQIAISIENALLYLTLEDKVKERTAEVMQQKEALEKSLADLKMAQTKLLESEKMASLGQLTAGLAHEINNPINFVSVGVKNLHQNFDELKNALQAYLSLDPSADNRETLQKIADRKLREQIAETVEDSDEMFRSIHNGINRTVSIVKSLRNFSRLDEGDFKPVDLHEGLESTLEILQSQIRAKAEVVRNYGQLPPVTCAPGKINQVFLNIINNALQAINGRGTITLTTAHLPEKNEVKVAISDSGSGMSEEVRSRLFEPFFTTKPVGEGTGLGLSISYGIINDHKGRIEVESEKDKGSTFTIYLPVKSET